MPDDAHVDDDPPAQCDFNTDIDEQEPGADPDDLVTQSFNSSSTLFAARSGVCVSVLLTILCPKCRDYGDKFEDGEADHEVIEGEPLSVCFCHQSCSDDWAQNSA